MIHLSVVIPVYKAEKFLPVLYDRLKASLETITEDFEIILVEDCGGDRSWEIIVALAKKESRVKGVQFSRNFGQHYGITAGLEASSGEYVIVMDCDLQHEPELIPLLYSEIQKGYDVILTQVTERKHAHWRNWGANFYVFIVNFLTEKDRVTAKFTSFSLLSRPVVDAFIAIKDAHRHYIPLVNYLGFSRKVIAIHHSERAYGKSSYNFYKLVTLTIDGIVSQSNRLLYMSIFLGLIFILVSLFGLLYVLFGYFLHGYKSGWTSTIVVLLLLGGSLHLAVGITGLYIAKIFDQVKQRPLYIIKNTLNL